MEALIFFDNWPMMTLMKMKHISQFFTENLNDLKREFVTKNIKKHLTTLAICIFMIGPTFLYFSKNYKLLTEIILTIWITGYFFVKWDYRFSLKSKTEAYDLTDEHDLGWLNDYVGWLCKEVGIERQPKLKLDREEGIVEIFGGKDDSTIFISEDFINEYGTSILQCVLMHEIGHLYYDHVYIKRFIAMFVMLPKIILLNIHEVIEFISDGLERIPLIGGIVSFVLHISSATIIFIDILFTLIVVQPLNFVIGRHFEYVADKFSYKLEGHEGLLAFFHMKEQDEKRKFFDFEEHPKYKNRKKRLLKYLSSQDSTYLNFDTNQLFVEVDC